MAAIRTAQYLCDRARDLVGEYDRSELRDGFAGDFMEADRSILPTLNQALSILGQAGFTQGDVIIPTTTGVYEYPIALTATDVIDVTYTTTVGATTIRVPLHAVEIVDLNNRVPGWRTTTPRQPNVFSTNGSSLIVWPPPPDAGPITIRAFGVPSDMALPTDTPATLPVIYHDAVAILAALLLTIGGVIADTDAAQARRTDILALWQMQDDSLTNVIDARTVLGIATRAEGGNS